MFRRHRQAFLERMQEGDLALFPGATHVVRNHDVEYPFRQHSDFYYLTGCKEPDAVLLLAKGVEGVPEELLLVLPKDPERETWTGVRLGPEGARDQLGFGAAAPIEELGERVPEAVRNAGRLWYRLGEYPVMDEVVLSALREARKLARHGVEPPAGVLDTHAVLAEMRLFKDEDELALMRRAAAVSAEAHLLAMAQARPGGFEYEIEALINYTFRRHGCDGWSYPAIVASGANACILHYTANDAELHDGDLFLIDAGAECGSYAADITRTFPVNGTFTPAQRDVYEAVLTAQKAAIDVAKPGVPFHRVHDTAVERLCEGLVELKVLTNPMDEILEKKLYREWYMHNTGHWIGLDVHDAGRYYDGGESRPLKEGMCMTVEPGLYFRPDDDRVPEALRGIGVRIEDDVQLTGSGCEILTVATPKEVADVEAACAAERVAPPTLDTELVVS